MKQTITFKGTSKDYNKDILREDLILTAKGLNNINIDEIIKEIENSLYNGIKEKEFKTAILNAVRALMERHYEYSSLASRLLFAQLYKDILNVNNFNSVNSSYQDEFKTYINKGVENDLLNKELKNFDLEKISKALKPNRDNDFYYLGAQTIYDRYLLRLPNKAHKVFELPQWFWMRVAMGLSLNEKNREDSAIEFYNTLSSFLFVSATPTLFNSGTTHSQLSSCYLNTVEDSLSGIFKNYSDVAQLSKWAGGIGSDWTSVRSMGSMIKGTNGFSQGIIPFIKIFNDIAVAVNQGGKRRGALSAYLEVWHSDVEEFFDLKKNTGDERRRAHDIHPVAWIPDLFMKRVLEDGDWALFSPSNVPELHEIYGKEFEKKYKEYEQDESKVVKRIKAKDLWRKMLTMLYETGHPWITFKDACNVRSPQDHAGVIHNSNLCTEITLNTSKDEVAVCNLGSINLSKMIKGKEIDKELLKKTIKTGMRMLDNVIDINFYPIPEAKNANSKNRPVGLGLMGYHDALYKMDIDFDSEKNEEFADYSEELISYYAIEASSELAKEKGAYKTFKGSKWDRGIFPIDTLDALEEERGMEITTNRNHSLDWDTLKKKVKEQGMRNSNCLTVAPTATISNISGVIPCVEPIFKNIYTKENLSGSFLVMNRALIDDLTKIGQWNADILHQIKQNDGSLANISQLPEEIKRKYKEVFEIKPERILKVAARRGKWIDQSASTNIFVSTSSGKYLSEIYMDAWKKGLKTTYYLRTLAASQISKTGDLPASSVLGKKACSIIDSECESCQ